MSNGFVWEPYRQGTYGHTGQERSSKPRPDREIGETGWKQYKEKEDKKVEQKKRLNTASIWVFARRMMAREWARALGKKSSSSRRN